MKENEKDWDKFRWERKDRIKSGERGIIKEMKKEFVKWREGKIKDERQKDQLGWQEEKEIDGVGVEKISRTKI